MGSMSDSVEPAAPRAWLLDPSPTPPVQIWGLTPQERLRRALRKAGCRAVECAEPANLPPPVDGPALLIRADAVYDERLIEGLCAARNTVLVASREGDWGGPMAAHVDADRIPGTLALLSRALQGDAAPAPSGLRLVAPDELAGAYNAALRKSERPFLFPACARRAREIEDRLFSASYKGITDLVTKWVWPRPATAVTRVLARAHVHPNLVTLASWILAVAAMLLFAEGRFATGLLVAWLMTFLDTVDGKLARVTLTSSRFGHVFDHSLDLLHPPFWWLAWGLALPAGYADATAVVVAGYVVGRLLEGIFLLAFKMETHCWRPIDSLFRTITARRNPNLVFLSVGTLGGRPDLGLVMVAIWTVISLAFHTLRLVQALVLRRRGQRIEPWDDALRGAVRPQVEGPVDAETTA
jgi:phosphatidylglycerophosphate synthase